MAEQRNQDSNESVTDQVAAFRRAARLADANPLRLLPTGALSVLQTLSAPFTDLINATPVTRLSEAIAKQTATGNAARTRVTSSVDNGIGQPAAQTRAKPTNGALDVSIAKATRPTTAAADTTLAQRRAQVRAITSRGASAEALPASGRSTPGGAGLDTIADLIRSSIEVATNRATSAGTRQSRQGNAVGTAGDLIGNIGRAAVDIVTQGINAVAGRAGDGGRQVANQSASAQEINRIIADFMARLAGMPASTSPAAKSTIERAIEAPGDLARITTDLVNRALTALVGPGAGGRRSATGALGPGLGRLIADPLKRAEATDVSPATNLTPTPAAAGGTAANDIGAGRGAGPAIQAPMRARDLFEALYRDGVDLSWP